MLAALLGIGASVPHLQEGFFIYSGWTVQLLDRVQPQQRCAAVMPAWRWAASLGSACAAHPYGTLNSSPTHWVAPLIYLCSPRSPNQTKWYATLSVLHQQAAAGACTIIVSLTRVRSHRHTHVVAPLVSHKHTSTAMAPGPNVQAQRRTHSVSLTAIAHSEPYSQGAAPSPSAANVCLQGPAHAMPGRLLLAQWTVYDSAGQLPSQGQPRVLIPLSPPQGVGTLTTRRCGACWGRHVRCTSGLRH